MTVRYIFGGIAIILGYLAGSLYANRTKQLLLDADTLYNALLALKTRICSYSSGLTAALQQICEASQCDFLMQIKDSLTNFNTISDVIENSEYPPQIKSSLSSLFDCIFLSDENEISKAFSSVLENINIYRNTLNEKNSKNGPLYRKLGLLFGISIFILLL